MNKTSYFIGFMVLLFSIAGCAGDSSYHKTSMPDPSTFNAHFGDLDTDGDDQVSWEESSPISPRPQKMFIKRLTLLFSQDSHHHF